MPISHKINKRRLRALLNSRTGPVAKDLERRGVRVQAAARRNLAGASGKPARIDTGRLRASITVRTLTAGGIRVRVGTRLRYARWVHDGTGVYGPRHTRIVPRAKKVLRFRPKGSRRWVFRRSVAGMRPNEFLKDALRAARQ